MKNYLINMDIDNLRPGCYTANLIIDKDEKKNLFVKQPDKFGYAVPRRYSFIPVSKNAIDRECTKRFIIETFCRQEATDNCMKKNGCLNCPLSSILSYLDKVASIIDCELNKRAIITLNNDMSFIAEKDTGGTITRYVVMGTDDDIDLNDIVIDKRTFLSENDFFEVVREEFDEPFATEALKLLNGEKND